MTDIRRLLAGAGVGLWLSLAPVPVAPVAYFAPVAQAQAADFLITYPSEAALDAVAQVISGLWIPTTTDANGVTVPGHVGDVHALPDGGAWAMTTPFRWPKPTGATTTDAEGNTVPVLADDGLWHRVFRWSAPFEALTPYLTAGGGTMTTDPDTGAITITAGPITMESPLPDDTPVRY